MASDSIAGVNGWLKANTPITDIVGARIYEKVLPQSPTYPAVSFWCVVTLAGATHDPAIGPFRDRIQFDCWGTSKGSLDSLAGTLITQLHGRIDTAFNGITLQGALFLSAREFEEDLRGQEALKNVRRKIGEFEIWYRF